MKTIVRCLLLLAPVVAAPAVAAEPFDPAARANAIAPFLDRQTIAVLHADLAQIEASRARIEGDPQSLASLLAAIQDFEDAIGAPAGRFLDRFLAVQHLEEFHENGFEDLYLVGSLADLPQRPPQVILPVTDTSDVDALLKSLGASNEYEQMEKLDDVLFFGSARALERIKAGKPDPRPQLVEAFRAAGDTAIQVLLLPTAEDRRVIEELLPELPDEIGGGPSTILTDGLLWAAFGVDLPPSLSLRMVIQSEDRPAAQALRDKLVTGLRILTQRAEGSELVRMFDSIAAVLIPRVDGDRLSLVLDEENEGFATVVATFTPSLEEIQAHTARNQGSMNLKYLGVAMHTWYDAFKTFPAQANYDANGKPLLSWRVHVLPFFDQEKLYRQFHLDEPWDSQHNRTLIEEMPDVYRSPASEKGRQGYTSYVMAVHEEAFCPGRRGVEFKEITDGTSVTIMLVEVDDDHAVIWTKPEDLALDLEDPAKGIGRLFEDGFQAAFCDGSAHFISHTIDPATLRALFTRAAADDASAYFSGSQR